MKKFISNYKKPSGLEAELLDCLAEECAEVIQRITKAKRFGTFEIQPGQELNNMQRLSQEIGDIFAVVEMLKNINLIDQSDIEKYKNDKLERLKIWLQNDN